MEKWHLVSDINKSLHLSLLFFSADKAIGHAMLVLTWHNENTFTFSISDHKSFNYDFYLNYYHIFYAILQCSLSTTRWLKSFPREASLTTLATSCSCGKDCSFNLEKINWSFTWNSYEPRRSFEKG